MYRVIKEAAFLKSLAAMNLSSVMEYRASFLTQVVGMMVNNGIYFVFWLIFFDQFGAIRGYEMKDIYLLFAIATVGYGIAHSLAGNVGPHLAYLIAQGRIDYYLVLPRPLLPHVIFSRMDVPAIGDLIFGIMAYLFTGRFHPVDIALFLLCGLLGGSIYIAFSVITGSLSFYLGNAQFLSTQLNGALLTFVLYPHTLFSSGVRLALLTLLPAGFIASVPVEIMNTRNGWLLLLLVAASGVFWSVATAVFYFGRRRYESGSALNVNV